MNTCSSQDTSASRSWVFARGQGSKWSGWGSPRQEAQQLVLRSSTSPAACFLPPWGRRGATASPTASSPAVLPSPAACPPVAAWEVCAPEAGSLLVTVKTPAVYMVVALAAAFPHVSRVLLPIGSFLIHAQSAVLTSISPQKQTSHWYHISIHTWHLSAFL